MNIIHNETKEQLIARLSAVHKAIAGTQGVNLGDNMSIAFVKALAVGDASSEFVARYHGSNSVRAGVQIV